jgi:tetratricopeptide (TPR) repeat protein
VDGIQEKCVSSRARLLIAAICLLAGAAFILLATDVLRWQSRMQSDDTRFAVAPGKRDLWQPVPLIPFGAAKALLQLDDDLAYRRASRVFALGRPRDQPYSDTKVIAQRGQAQELLADVVERDDNPRRRSAAANLIGVLGFANAALDAPEASAYLAAAIEEFRAAISFDPENADAKYNLELALARLRDAEQANGTPPPPDTRGGSGAGAGTGQPGSGY